MKLNRRQLLAGAGSAWLTAVLPRAYAATTTLANSPRTVVAAYFGGWRVIMDKSQRGVHGDNPWANYPTATQPYVTHRMKDYPGRFPLIGDPSTGYDESQQWVMDKEITIASTYGINVFAMNWYRDEFLNHPVVNFKASGKKSLMKFFLQWSNTANTATTPAVAYTRAYFFEGMRRAAIHMRDTSYWKQNGLPVFSLFDTTHIDRILNAKAGRAASYTYPTIAQATSEHDNFLKECHYVVSNVLAGDDTGGISGSDNAAVVSTPAYLKQSGAVFKPSMYLMLCTSDVGSWARCTAISGLYMYNIRRGTFSGQSRLTHSFDEVMTACQQNYDLLIPALKAYSPGKVFWPTVMSGFDQRPWGGTTADPLHDNSVPTQAQFVAHCKQVRGVLDANPTITNNTVFVYAWNELGEGGYITPTPNIGYTRLTALRDYIKL